jgi:hypothetical protein
MDNLIGRSASLSFSHYHSIDVTKIKLFPSEPYYWHSKAVTAISVKVNSIEGDNDIYLPFSGRRKVQAMISSISKDSLLKVCINYHCFIPTSIDLVNFL